MKSCGDIRFSKRVFIRCHVSSRRMTILPRNNRATVVIEVIEEVPVLVVEGAAGQAELQQDAFFLQAAMGWMNGEAMEAHSVYRPVVVSPEQLEGMSLRISSRHYSEFHCDL